MLMQTDKSTGCKHNNGVIDFMDALWCTQCNEVVQVD